MRKLMILTLLSFVFLTPMVFAAEDPCIYQFNTEVNIAFTELEDCYSDCYIQVNGWCDWECDTRFDRNLDGAINSYNDCMG